LDGQDYDDRVALRVRVPRPLVDPLVRFFVN
jgi:hypothetical protein